VEDDRLRVSGVMCWGRTVDRNKYKKS
jgi:hypothetical protein